jgi:hypothetical protein
LWNLGQAYRRQFDVTKELASLRRAIDCYRRYLDDAPKGENRETASRLVAELTAQLPTPPPVETAPPPVETAPPPVETAPPKTISEPGGAKLLAPEPRTAAPSPARKPLYKRWWVWTATGAIVAAVAAGVGIGLGAHGKDPTPSMGSMTFSAVPSMGARTY